MFISRAAITKYYLLGDLNNRNLFLTVLKAESPRSSCQKGKFLLRAVKERVCSRPLLVYGGAAGSLWCWLVEASP